MDLDRHVVYALTCIWEERERRREKRPKQSETQRERFQVVLIFTNDVKQHPQLTLRSSNSSFLTPCSSGALLSVCIEHDKDFGQSCLFGAFLGSFRRVN